MPRIKPCFVMLLVLWAVAALSFPVIALPAFPGAQGFGSETPGGRGGHLYFVTELSDDPVNPQPGTLRHALEASGPRVVIFRTGGTITLQRSIVITEPFVTIAGQTAPGDGIQIRNDPDGTYAIAADSFPSLVIETHDVVIRYLRVRPGSLEYNPDCDSMNPPQHPQGWTTCVVPGDIDGIQINRDAHHVVLDHVSVNWATDEMIAVLGAQDVTLQWSIVGDGLDYLLYSSQTQNGKAMMLGNTAVADDGFDTSRISIHHNLFAHSYMRLPQLTHYCADPTDPLNCAADTRHNVAYNWVRFGTLFANVLGHTFSNIVGNVYRVGPDHQGAIEDGLTMRDWRDHPDNAQIDFAQIGLFAQDNLRWFGESSFAPYDVQCFRWEGALQACDPNDYAIAELATPGVTAQSAQDSLVAVLEDAGARRRLDQTGAFVDARDSVDQRLVDDTRNGTGGIVGGPEQHPVWPVLDSGVAPPDGDGDGMPDRWETTYGLDPAQFGPWNDTDADGYGDLEEFLNGTHPSATEVPAVSRWSGLAALVLIAAGLALVVLWRTSST